VDIWPHAQNAGAARSSNFIVTLPTGGEKMKAGEVVLTGRVSAQTWVHITLNRTAHLSLFVRPAATADGPQAAGAPLLLVHRFPPGVLHDGPNDVRVNPEYLPGLEVSNPPTVSVDRLEVRYTPAPPPGPRPVVVKVQGVKAPGGTGAASSGP
jgi:hypothetical protein